MRFSIIIPAYNAESTILSCIENIEKIEFDLSKVEVLVVNDGSKDATRNVIEDAIRKSKLNIRLINKQNGGVSSARNAGLKEATGEYILFLDADDKLSKDCLKELDKFLRKNEVHIVVFNITYERNNKRHWRAEFLKNSGIYNIDEYCYGAITTVNFCIRNRRDQNELFDERFFMHEDEEFAFRNVLIDGKYGFCKEASYHYDNTNEMSAINTKLNPYYSFNQSIRIYKKIIETSIAKLKKVSRYAQALIINDLSWKLRAGVLFSESNITQAEQVNKVKEILGYIEPVVILNHPNIDKFHKHFFLNLAKIEPKIYFVGQKIMFEVPGYKEHVKQNEIYVTSVTLEDKWIKISGFYKTFITNYIDKHKIKIYALYGLESIECEQRPTYYSYHRSKTLTNNFIGFDLKIKPSAEDLSFFVTINNRLYKVNRFSFKNYNDRSNLCIRLNNFSLFYDKIKAVFKIREKACGDYLKGLEKTSLLSTSLNIVANTLKRIRHIALYNDREGVFDNALIQFLYDIKKTDGVQRYYVSFSDVDRKILLEKYLVPEANIIEYRSIKHQIYYLSAREVITSFVDASFYQPISAKKFKHSYAEFCSPEIIYLQHGVLHAKTLHYAKEFLNIDKVIISTRFEEKYYKELGFSDEQLLKVGSNRYSKPKEILHVSPKIKKVLYLPSWRSYLADKQNNNRWLTNVEKFKSSLLWKELQKLGICISGHQNFKIDVQLHPILFSVEDVVKKDGFDIVKKVDYSDYDLVVTDYSSVVYDAVYSGVPVMYFCPDIEMFESGVNLYSEILTPMRDGFGPLSITAEELLNNILSLDSDSSSYIKKYKAKYENLFLNFDNPLEGFYRNIFK